DLIVLDGNVGDPYHSLLSADESSILLTIIDGVPALGSSDWMSNFALPGRLEPWPVGPKTRTLYLDREDSDPIVRNLTLGLARDRLADGLKRLPELAKALENPPVSALRAAADPTTTEWYLLLDHDEVVGETQRPHLPFGANGLLTGDVRAAASAKPLSRVVKPLTLDPLCVADDPTYLDRLHKQRNLPKELKARLRDL
ncbi:MAG: amidohydrolase, partial [Candidatus Bipolaricaulota bacterium]|nr:amidohydrolase [Candidatus Bipolaricaulota bacterium]